MIAKHGMNTAAARRRARRPEPRRPGLAARFGTGSAGAAKAALPALELPERAQQVLLRKVRPQDVGEVELGVGELPEEEVADTLFAARPDEKIGLRKLRLVQVAREAPFVQVLGAQAPGGGVRRDPPRGIDDLPSAAVREREVEN